MYTKKSCFSCARAASFFIALNSQSAASASELLVEFDFDDGVGGFENVANFEHASLGAMPWTSAKGSLSNFSGEPGFALAARNFADGNSLELKIIVAGGWSLTIDTIGFDHFASASGPKSWSLAINGQALAGGSTPASFSHVNTDLNLMPVDGTVLIALSGTAADSNNGTYRIDNFVLNGAVTPVPLPAAALLLGPTVLALMRYVRG